MDELKIGDICTVHLDWADKDLRGKHVQIGRFQNNDGKKFACIIWKCRRESEMEFKYGHIFALDELKKV